MLVYKELENKTEKCPHLTFSRKKKRNGKYISSPPASLLGKTYGVLEFNAKKEDGLKGGRGNLLHFAMRRGGGRRREGGRKSNYVFPYFSRPMDGRARVGKKEISFSFAQPWKGKRLALFCFHIFLRRYTPQEFLPWIWETPEKIPQKSGFSWISGFRSVQTPCNKNVHPFPL